MYSDQRHYRFELITQYFPFIDFLILISSTLFHLFFTTSISSSSSSFPLFLSLSLPLLYLFFRHLSYSFVSPLSLLFLSFLSILSSLPLSLFSFPLLFRSHYYPLLSSLLFSSSLSFLFAYTACQTIITKLGEINYQRPQEEIDGKIFPEQVPKIYRNRTFSYFSVCFGLFFLFLFI